MCVEHFDILRTLSQTSKFKVNASEAKLIISRQFLDDIFFHRVTFLEYCIWVIFILNLEVKITRFIESVRNLPSF